MRLTSHEEIQALSKLGGQSGVLSPHLRPSRYGC